MAAATIFLFPDFVQGHGSCMCKLYVHSSMSSGHVTVIRDWHSIYCHNLKMVIHCFEEWTTVPMCTKVAYWLVVAAYNLISTTKKGQTSALKRDVITRTKLAFLR